MNRKIDDSTKDPVLGMDETVVQIKDGEVYIYTHEPEIACKFCSGKKCNTLECAVNFCG